MAALLRVVEGLGQGLWLAIPNGQTITFGRAATAGYDFEDTLLSREHAAFQCKGKACRVADLKSRNGTFVNDEKIDAPRLLSPGDRIRIGSIVFEFVRAGILREMSAAMATGPVPAVSPAAQTAVPGAAPPPPPPPPPPIPLAAGPLSAQPVLSPKQKRASKRLSKKVQRDLSRLGQGPAPGAQPAAAASASPTGEAGEKTAIVDPPSPADLPPLPTVQVSPSISEGVAAELLAAQAAIAAAAPATPPTVPIGPPVSDEGVPAFSTGPLTPAAPQGEVDPTIDVAPPSAFFAPTAPFPFVPPLAPNAPTGKRRTSRVRGKTAAGPACQVCHAPIGPDEQLMPVRGRLACPRCVERYDLNPDMIPGFKLIERLRKTRTGTVYKAEQLLLRRLVLVKTLETNGSDADRKSLERFMREAKTAGKLRHPAIVELFDVNDQGGIMYLVMEFVEGESLDQIIASRGSLPVGQAVRYMHHTGEALFHAHEQNIVHRDIRPATIVVARDNDQAKVADFSLAKSAESSAYSVTGNSEYNVPLYMPPEQVIGGTGVDARSDIYSFAATFYHALSGRVPLDAKKLSDYVKKLRGEEPAPLSRLVPHLPVELSDLVARALAKDPAKRYEDMSALMNDLSSIRVALGISV